MSISADAQKQQRLQLQQESGSQPVPSETRTATALTDQEQRNTLKFGFSSKGNASKVCPPGIKVLKRSPAWCLNMYMLIPFFPFPHFLADHGRCQEAKCCKEAECFSGLYI